MKKFLLFAGVMFLSTTILTSCGSKDEKKDEDKDKKEAGWGTAVKDAYMKSCVQSAEMSIGADKANEYCECTMNKMMEKFPNPADMDKVSESEMTSLAMECMTADMMPAVDMGEDTLAPVE